MIDWKRYVFLPVKNNHKKQWNKSALFSSKKLLNIAQIIFIGYKKFTCKKHLFFSIKNVCKAFI